MKINLLKFLNDISLNSGYMEKITSIANTKIQDIKKLLSSKDERVSKCLFLAEGVNIVKDIPNQYIKQLLMTEHTYNKYPEIATKCSSLYILTDKVMNAISDTKTPSGVVAVCDKDIKVNDSTSCVVLDNLQDPGNAGTIIRTAVACGISTIYCYGDCVDLYSPKVVRSSMGGIFFVNVKRLDNKEDIDCALLVLDMAGENLFEFDNIPEKFALLVGNESKGVSKEMRAQADRIISLPMSKNMESLNAGVSLSIALYNLMNIKR